MNEELQGTENEELVDTASLSTEDEGSTSPEEVHEELLGEPIESADLISTAEFAVPETDESSKDDKTSEDDKTEETDSEASTDEKGKGLTKEEQEKLDVTFQQSPRFQELISQKNEYKTGQLAAEAKVEAFEQQLQSLTELVKSLGGKPAETGGGDPGFKNVLSMADEDIIENFESDPKGFLGNFAKQITHEVESKLAIKNEQTQKMSQQQAQEQAVNELYADYENKNPDFVDMWERGEIQKYMEENPGNTPISAHQMLKVGDLKKGQAKEMEEAIAKAVEETQKKFVTKQSARTISAGPGGGAQKVTTTTPADLANTKEHGGLMQVLTKRSLAREKAAG